MDSNTIRIGLMLIILVWSVISAITYMARRSGNKGALRELKQEGQPLRRLSAQEQALVQPFLVRPAKPTQSVALLNDGVFPLRGAFVRHGLESGHGAATMHDTLGGVDVVLPYDARDYLREDNQAEVVMTEKFAIVVALNGEFDLAGGREREARRQKQNQQWSSGKLGAMQNVVDAEDVTADGAGQAPDAQAEHEFAEAMRVEILSQREETPAEIAWRRPAGIAFWPAMLWLAAFVCLGVAAAGGGMAWLAFAMMSRPFAQSTSTFFLERALTEGGGTNVVNVMLVDFRGFDTFGEIVVLGIVALTVYALLRRFRPAVETMDLPEQQRYLPADLQTDLLNPRNATDTAIGYLMVPAVLVRLLLPFSALVAFYLFMRGHNQPGGGFVAGLVFSVGLVLQYIISGTSWVEAHLPLYPRRWIASGLLLALGTGLGAVALGYPFLTSHTAHLHLPLIGDLHVASAMFFDMGVFALVVGSTLLILTAIAHQSVRSHRYHARLMEEEQQAASEQAAVPATQGAV